MRIISSIAVITILSACNGTGSTDSISYDSSIVRSSTKQVSTDSGQTVMINDSQLINPQQLNQPVLQNPVEIQKVTLNPKGLNPEHGQPGHRCDIAVGAPLNSPPSPSAVAGQTTPQPVNQKTATGMNPEHGQPGHRCDIAVGAPLNSAPTKNIPTAQPTTPAAVNAQPQAPPQLQAIQVADSAVKQ